MSTSIFSESGTAVKTLKDQLSLNDVVKIRSGTDDPRAVAKEGAQGSLYLQTGSSGGKVFRKLDSGTSTNWTEVGSGAGGINYITNPDAEAGTTGWSTYADAAGVTPVDGTGGTATVTLTASTSSPLRGLQSFLLTKDAANRQGEGVSVPFTVERADFSEVMVVEFDYEVSANFVAGSASDIRVFLYDIDAAQLITPIDHRLEAIGVGKYKAYFQSSATSDNYRLIFHVATTSALAYTMKFDNVRVGPKSVFSFGSPNSDWVDYSGDVVIPSCYGTVADVEYWGKRIGDTLMVRGVFQCGTLTGSDATFVLPPGLSIDSAKFIQNGSDPTRDGRHYLGIAYALVSAGSALDAGPTYAIFYDKELDDIYLTNQTEATREFDVRPASAFINTSEVIAFQFQAPISGWGSQLQTSEDVDLRNVVVSANASESTPASATAVTFGTINFDTHGAFDGTTFTAPVGGYYDIEANVTMNPSASTAGTGGVAIQLNTVDIGITGSNGIPSAGQNYSFQANARGWRLEAGDEIQVLTSQNTGNTVTTSVYLSIVRTPGPAVVAPTEAVVVITEDTTGQSIPNATETAILFANKVTDTHGAWNTGTGTFTAPVKGNYMVTASFGISLGPTNGYTIVEKNGSVANTKLAATWFGSASEQMWQNLAGLIPLEAGDTIQVKVSQSSGGTETIDTVFVGGGTLSIYRLGGI